MRKILGLDPGTNFFGYAILNEKKQVELSGVIKLNKIKNPYEKLKLIFQRLDSIIKEFSPTEMAIEAPFYGKNVQSMLKLGRSQGVAIAVGILNGLTITEYSPKAVKQAVTGNGSASKQQVAYMLNKILDFRRKDNFADESDALAVAFCHLNNKFSKTNKKYKDWNDFLSKNTEKIISK